MLGKKFHRTTEAQLSKITKNQPIPPKDKGMSYETIINVFLIKLYVTNQ